MKFTFLRLVLFLILTVLPLAGCGGAGSSTTSAKGAVTLSVDLQSLARNNPAKAALAATPSIITAATIEVSRSGYQSITQNMAIANNIASCRIDDLDQGYWHIVVHVFSDNTEIYTGNCDSNVVPGAVTQASILFDPVVIIPTTGSISVTTGINPMPGYGAINQQVTKALVDPVRGKLYIYDATTKTIGVYTADTMTRTSDITLAAAPTCVAFTANKDAMLLGYTSGQVYRVNLSTGSTTLVGDVLLDVGNILTINDRIALIASPSGATLKTLDLTTGQVLSTKSYYYNMGEMVLNETNGLVYALDVNVSPVDLFRIKVDPATGVIGDITDSPYHGDYYLWQPLRVIKNGSRLVTAAGTMFSSSTVAAQDMLYSGKLGYSCNDLAVDSAKNRLYLINNNAPYKLLILNQDSYFLETTVELLGTPKLLYVTPAKIIVITLQNSAYYAKVFDKADLGL